jgi:diguanylate cyclase (GGDEF)-like protein/PAS domain S-box-containing protein
VARGRGRAVAWALAVLALGVIITLAIGASVRDAERDAEDDRFDQSAEQASQAIERSVQGSFDELTGIGAYLAATPDATSDQFARFVAGSGIFERLPSLAGVLYLAQVAPEDLDTYLADHDLNLFAIGERPEGRPHLVLAYYVPGSVDLELPLGADASAIIAISDVVADASAEGAGAAGSFQDDPLLQQIAAETDYGPIERLLDIDYFAGVPVYEEPLAAVDPSVDRPIGWLAAPVENFDSVLAAASDGLPADLGVSLQVDLTTAGTDADTIERLAEDPGLAGPLDGAAHVRAYEFTVDGMPWALTVWAGAEPPTRTLPLVVLGGFLASMFASMFTYARVRARDRDRAFALELAEREQFQRVVLDSVEEPMVVLDGEGTILAANPAWSDLRQLPASDEPDRDIGGSYLELLGRKARGGVEEVRAGLEHVAAGDRRVEVDVPVEVAGGRRWFAVRMTPLRGRRGGAVVVHNDITERKRSEAELELKATHDGLTGLLNRAAMEEEVNRALHRARVQEAPIGVLFIDLDGFKPINDNYGHTVGDDVLRAVAQRISGAVRTSDRVARLGGDEFVVLVGPLNDRGAVEITARRILESLARPVHIGDLQVPVAASIGVAVLDAPLGGSAKTLIELADRAMYEAKQSGGNRFTVGE